MILSSLSEWALRPPIPGEHDDRTLLGPYDPGPSADRVLHGVAGVNDQRCMLANPVPVVGRMVRNNEHTILGPEVLRSQFLAGHTEVRIMAHRRKNGNVRIVV